MDPLTHPEPASVDGGAEQSKAWTRRAVLARGLTVGAGILAAGAFTTATGRPASAAPSGTVLPQDLSFQTQPSPMYAITVELLTVRCRDTESTLTSDKFALTGVVFTEEPGNANGNSPIVYPTMRINDGEQRVLGTKHSVQSANPVVGLALVAFDIDENDWWTESEGGIAELAAKISGVVGGINAPAGGVVAAVSLAMWGAVEGLTRLDRNDKLLDYSKLIPIAAGAVGHPAWTNHTVNFSRDDWSGYSDWDYSIDMRIVCEPLPEVVHHLGRIHRPGEAMDAFRQRARAASDSGFLGAFPNFYEAKYDNRFVGGAIMFQGGQAEWRDVPTVDLGNPNLDDFSLRMRATQDYAVQQGFVGGFPNFFHADYGAGVVCGTVLLPAASVQWRDLPWAEIGNPDPADIQARFRGVHDWAVAHMFVGGFPNMYHADKSNGRVAGAVLVKPGAGTWQDVLLRLG
jgi:hypothetical protein